MRNARPLTPDEAENQRKSNIPDWIINCVNKILVENLKDGEATFNQDELMTEIMKVAPEGIERQTIFDNNWLDFEEIYREAGWEVEYDKPGYCEDYQAYWEFKDKRRSNAYD